MPLEALPKSSTNTSSYPTHQVAAPLRLSRFHIPACNIKKYFGEKIMTKPDLVHACVYPPNLFAGVLGSGFYHNVGLRLVASESDDSNEFFRTHYVSSALSSLGSARLLSLARKFRYRRLNGSVENCTKFLSMKLA